MADDAQPTSPKNEAPHAEDAETRATRRELKQSSISDPDLSADKTAVSSKNDTEDRPETPDEEDLKDQVASPKKKRAHDQLDSSRDKEDAASVASADSSKDRSERSEPEKKRARDEDAKETVRSPDHAFTPMRLIANTLSFFVNRNPTKRTMAIKKTRTQRKNPPRHRLAHSLRLGLAN